MDVAVATVDDADAIAAVKAADGATVSRSSASDQHSRYAGQREGEEDAMRKIVAGLFMSLDGVVEYPENWGFQYFDEEMTKGILEGIAQADAVLIGRRTYLEFAEMWPTQGSEVPMSDFLNKSHKYVVSSGLDKLDWGPASLVKGDLADALTKLKHEPGRNIQIPGSPTLVRSLLAEGMLDELTLNICPIVVGSGLRLFEDVTGQLPLNVVQSTALSSGVINATYQPASAQQASPEPSVETFPGQ
jgi:dihydrofolate reductase